MQDQGEEILRLEGVSKSFGGVKAVQDVTLTIRRGGVYGLIGPNGSGKSTLFNLISGVIKSDEGRIFLKSRRIDQLPPYRIYELGLGRSFQIPRLFFGMTVLDNALTAPKGQIGEHPINSLFRKKWEKQEAYLADKAEQQLSLLEIAHLYTNLPTELSGGQMKLLQLALALMGDPELVLLDEPTAGVAPTLAFEIFSEIEARRKRMGTTFFIIEHRLEILFEYADYIFVMHQGKIISQGKPDEVVHDSKVIEAYLGG